MGNEARRSKSSTDPVCPSIASHAASDIVSPGTRHRASGFCEALLGCPRVAFQEQPLPAFHRWRRPLAHRRRSSPLVRLHCGPNRTLFSLGTHCVPGDHNTFHEPWDTCVMPPKIPRHDAESAATGCRSGMVPERTINLTRVAQSRKLCFGRPLRGAQQGLSTKTNRQRPLS